MATADKLIAQLREAMAEERAALAEQMKLKQLCDANLRRRVDAEEAMSAAHNALELFAEKSA